MPLCNVSPIQSWSSFNKLVCFHFYLLLASVSQHWMLAPATVMSSCQTPNQSQRKPPTNLLLMSRKILWTQNLFLSQVQGGKRVKKSLKIYLYWKVCKSFWFFFLIITYLIIIDPGFFDGIKSFNPHGQRITLEDAVVRACYIFLCLEVVSIFFQGIENPVLGFSRGLPHPRLDAGTEVQWGWRAHCLRAVHGGGDTQAVPDDSSSIVPQAPSLLRCWHFKTTKCWEHRQ